MSSADTVYPSLDSTHHHESHTSSTNSNHPQRGLSAGAQSRSPSASAESLSQPPPMNVPISYYGADQPVLPADDASQYQQWLQNYYTHAQHQAQYTHPTEISAADMSHLYDVGSSSILPQEHPQSMPNRYNFVQSTQQNTDHVAYNSPYPSSQPPQVQPRITRPIPRSNNMNRSGFNMGYQQAQSHSQYPIHSQGPIATASVSYFTPTGVADRSQDPSYEFSFQPPATEQITHTSNDNYTPNSESNPPPASNPSPSSWAGTDESTSYPTYSAAPNPSSSSDTRRAVPGRRKSNKRPRQDRSEEPASGSEEEDGPQSAVPPLRGPDANPQRLPGACTHCKKLKMRCEFPKGENTCRRCRTSGHPCIVEGRKPRNTPNKREYLLAQIRQKDAIIESLLKQLHNPYLATPLSIASYRMATSPSDQNKQNILIWLDRLQDSVRTAGGSGGTNAFNLDSRNRAAADGEEESDSEAEEVGEPTERGSVGTVKIEEEEKKMQLLPDTAVPLGLIADLSLNNTKKTSAKGDDDNDDDNVGVANETYFVPGPAYDLGMRANLIEQHSPPDILVHGLVTPEDVDKLFEIFFARLNVHVSVLDPVLHTPSTTFARCPFLFTVVCAVASRYYEQKSEIYPIAMHFAKHAAANALITGWKSVELAQAYIILSIYGVPARRWEEDRGWLYTGLAIRIATDLNLHHMPTVKPTSERHEREIMNRIRVWLNCYNLDKSTATQFGKPSTIKEDFIVRKSDEWYRTSPYNHPYDSGLCAYTSQLRIMARFHEEVYSDPDSPNGLNERLDFKEVTLRHDEQLTRYYNDWKHRLEGESDMHNPSLAFRSKLLPFFTNYSRLVMYSFGFQQAFRRGMQGEDCVIVDKCFQAAKAVILAMVDGLAPTGFMRYSPDSHFIFGTFASAFLLKLLKPEFSNMISKEQEEDIFQLIGRLIQTLNSPEIAIDDRHTPKLHARFLAGLLSKHRRDVATTGRLHAQPPPSQAVSDISTSAGVGGSQQVFSFASGSGAGSSHSSTTQGTNMEQNLAPEPVYEVEAAYTTDAGPMEMLDFSPSPGSADDEMLGALLALKNPSYWQNMMMPGFSWAEPRTTTAPAPNGYTQDYSAMYNGFETSQTPGLTA
ncbi:hypothetical protein BDY19DRAFT_970897 [Irpex rosettiformis]|uniref:Uncharacterized protein n=1 Tax=Irpex rosettiformis TaxID=378272 RepID=A0ACB8TRU6_9APHY|nr:hypothetical protein BDY19DRAFT_970897 [Irpex rosettiformis]